MTGLGRKMISGWGALALLPLPAWACALPPSIILTLPTGYYLWGAGLTVALTALIVARLPAKTHARFAPNAPYRTPQTSAETAGSYGAFVAFLALLLIGFLGPRDPMHNLLTLVFWTVIWVALPLICAAFGNGWRWINPFTGPIRLTRTLIGRERSIGLTRLGHWPAVAGLFAFSWFQIVSMSPEDPLTLAQVLLGYWLIIFLAGVAEGEDWIWQGEFFSLYLQLLSRLSPIAKAKGTWRLVTPSHKILSSNILPPSGVGFITLMLAALSFDGLRDTFWWLGLIGQNPLEFAGRSAVMWENTLGLIGSWALTAALILGALHLGQRIGQTALPLGTIMLSFLAIAAGYHGAHYLLMLLTAGQYLLSALNDPFFRGDAYLGLQPFWVSYGFLTDRKVMTTIWNLQFALILGAHMLAIVLSHRLAGSAKAKRGLIGLDLLMVGYTIFGLWMLASPTGA